MKINDLDLGYNPIRKFDGGFGQTLGDASVVGGPTSTFTISGQRRTFTFLAWISAPALGGFAAGTQGANELLARQLEEWGNNASWQTQSPVYIRWSSVRALPQDGWYLLSAVSPDYTYTGAGRIPVTMQVTYVSPGPPTRHAMATFGGALKSAYTGVPTNFVGLMGINPIALVGTIVQRASAEGAIAASISPGLTSVPFVPSSSIDDWFKGAVRAWDTMSSALNPVPATLFNDGFEGGGSTPVLPNPAILYSESFENAGTTQTLWRSLGGDATGTLAYWTQVSGVWAIASNVVTSPTAASQLMVGGHPDWTDGTADLRVIFATNSQPCMVIHTDGTASNMIYVRLTATALELRKVVAGVDSLVGTVAVTPVTTTPYWLQILCNGTSYTASLFNDSAGVKGTLNVAVAVQVIADAALQSGKMGVFTGAGQTVAFTCGGPNNSTCAFFGTAPIDPRGITWTPGVTAGEPAFAWSTKRAYYGTRSLSVFNAIAGGQGFWSGSVQAGGTYTLAASLWGSGTPTTFDVIVNPALAAPISGIATANSTWQLVSNAGTNAGGAIAFLAYGQGTYYCDNFAVFTTVTPTNPLFRSLGTDALGTLAAWTTQSGAPSISANVLTVPANARLAAGHADWGDCIATVRFVWATGGTADIECHNVDANNWIRAYCDGVNIVIQKDVASVLSGSLTQASAPLTNGSAYWLRIQAIGTTYVGTLYADFSGVIGSQLAQTPPAVIADAAIQNGRIALAAAGASITFGGATTNVCLVQGAYPLGWLATPAGAGWTAGEPAFAWSKLQARTGLRSLSIFIPTGQTWTGVWFMAPGSIFYTGTVATTATAYIKTASVTGTGAFQQIWQNGSSSLGTSTPQTGTSGFTLTTLVVTPTAGVTGLELDFRLTGPGTAWFDDAIIPAPSNGSSVHPNWVEIKGPDHQFSGDLVITNGLRLLLFQAPSPINGFADFFWDTTLAVPAWHYWADNESIDNGGSGLVTRSCALERVGPEECSAIITVSSIAGALDRRRIRLQRGRYEIRDEESPQTEANSNIGRPLLVTALPTKAIYNSAGLADCSLGTVSLPPSTDYGYGAGLSISQALQALIGILYPDTSNEQPFGNSTQLLGAGDTSGPAKGATRTYGSFAVPFASAWNLHGEAEGGSFSGGWVGAAEPLASGLAAAKLPAASGAGYGATQFGSAAFALPPGFYQPWVRVRKGTVGAGATVDLVCFVVNVTDNVSVVSIAFSPTTVAFFGGAAPAFGPTAATTSWQLFPLPLFSPVAGKTYRFQADNQAHNPSIDWYVDEMFLVPVSLTDTYRGPQDIDQQWAYERKAELAVPA